MTEHLGQSVGAGAGEPEQIDDDIQVTRARPDVVGDPGAAQALGQDVEDVLDPDLRDWSVGPAAAPAIRVTAVLVAHDGAGFLPRTLDAIHAQTRPPDHLIAVDAGSTDASGDLLTMATGRVLRLRRDTPFGDAVQAALIARDAAELAQHEHPRDGIAAGSQVPAVEPATATRPETRRRWWHRRRRPGFRANGEWLWLLHDDSAPAPDVLERLVQVVDAGPSIGIAGCKQVSWDDGRRLLDVGFTVSRLGARVTGVDVDDMDQGQLDHRSDVLAVSTAGMLVRRDVWDQLGGTDPALVHARDDLDLCRRAHLAGLRVVVVPWARVAHAAATATGRRGPGAGPSWGLRDRRAAIHLRLAATPLVVLPFLLAWLAGAAVLRAAARLVLKQPGRAGAELAAFGLAAVRPTVWWRARRRIRRGRVLPRRDYRRLLAGPRSALRQRRDALTAHLRTQEEAWSQAAVAVPRQARTGRGLASGSSRASTASAFGQLGLLAGSAGAPTAIGTATAGPTAGQASDPGPGAGPLSDLALVADDELGEDFEGDRPRPAARAVTRIALLLAVLLTGVGLAGLRVLLGGTGTALGPALIPMPTSSRALWALASSGWATSGLGRPAVADPFDAVLAGLSWLLGGSTATATELLLIGALPLAGLLAWWAAGGVTRSRALRAFAALGWAASPSLLTAVAAGRLSGIVAHLALPPAGLALARAIAARPAPGPGERPVPAAVQARGSISAASCLGLLLTVLVAAAPSLTLPVLVALLVTVLVAGRGRRLVGWAALVPAVLLLPWWAAVVRDPRLLLAEPGGAGDPGPGPGGWVSALWPGDPASFQLRPLQRAAQVLAQASSLGTGADWLRAGAVALAVPLIGLALYALVRPVPGRGRIAATLWLVGLTGLLVAAAVPVLDTRAGADGGLRGWAGPGLSLFTLGLFGAALSRLDGAAARLRARSLGWRHWVAVLTGLVSVLTPALGLAAWTIDGWNATSGVWVHRGSPDILPAVAAAEAEGPAATRTLVLSLSGADVRWSLLRSGGPRLGQDSAASLTRWNGLHWNAAPARPAAADRPVLVAIGGLLSDAGRDQRTRLTDLDIGSIFLLDSRGASTAAAALALDTAPGLSRVVSTGTGVLWQVQLGPAAGSAAGPAAPVTTATGAGNGSGDAGPGPTRPARVRILGPDGTVASTLPSDGLDVRADIPAGSAGRTLVLAERADPRWHAWLNGRPLAGTAPHAGWAQSFAVPAAGGRITVALVEPGQRASDLARLVIAAMALLMAVPLPRHRPRLTPPPRPRRGRPGADPFDTDTLTLPAPDVVRRPAGARS